MKGTSRWIGADCIWKAFACKTMYVGAISSILTPCSKPCPSHTFCSKPCPSHTPCAPSPVPLMYVAAICTILTPCFSPVKSHVPCFKPCPSNTTCSKPCPSHTPCSNPVPLTPGGRGGGTHYICGRMHDCLDVMGRSGPGGWGAGL